MIEGSLSSWLAVLALIVLASASGIAVARLLPWTAAARAARMPEAFGIGLGPFFAGILVVVALAVFPGAASRLHITFVFVVLSIALLVTFAKRSGASSLSSVPREPWRATDWLLAALFAVVGCSLIFVACTTPLVQNDSLEYATIGRLLFESRDLASSPVLDPQTNSAGAYYPWTHPPLYVSLIYLVYQLQSHADVPGLIRLLAPWFLLASAMLTYSLARGVNRSAGLLAALLLMTTPLLFTGSIAALMDGLPVMGFAAIVAVVIGIDCGPRLHAILIGATLGLALWTHSQAVLLIPICLAAIAFKNGLSQPWNLTREALIVLAVAALIGAWPYVRNYLLMGELIVSDSSAATFPGQDWPGYFQFNRGLDNPVAVIQYGILKGWFAFEAYSLLFWFMAFGIGRYIARLRRQTKMGIKLSDVIAEHPAVWVCLGLLVCYLMGIIASVLIGVDVLIRNERYALMVTPAVAVLAAFGFAYTDQQSVSRLQAIFLRAMWGALVLMLGAQVLVLSAFMLRPSYSGFHSFGRPVESALWKQPPYAVTDWIRRNTPLDSVILSLKPSDMYYSGRRMLSYADPRLVGFYSQTTTGSAVLRLRDLGVTHVQVSDYDLPNFYDSKLQAILRDPQFATLLEDTSGYQLYALAPAALEEGRRVELVSVGMRWSKTSQLIIGGRRALASVGFDETPLGNDVTSDTSGDLGLFHRDRSASLVAERVPIRAGAEYALDLEVRGRGAIRFWLRGYSDRGIQVTRFMFGDTFLNEERPLRNLGYRFKIPPGWSALAVELEHLGSSWLSVDKATLIELRMRSVSEIDQ